MLPLGPAGDSSSPYQCLSSFAGNPLLISPDQLLEEGLLERADLRGASLPAGRINYSRRGKEMGAARKSIPPISTAAARLPVFTRLSAVRDA